MKKRVAEILFSVLLTGWGVHHCDAADLTRGAQLAQQWCSACHAVGGMPAGSIVQGPPAFAAIAQSQMPVDQLRAFLAHPHGAMPDLALSRAEIDDLIAYIRTLK